MVPEDVSGKRSTFLSKGGYEDVRYVCQRMGRDTQTTVDDDLYYRKTPPTKLIAENS